MKRGFEPSDSPTASVLALIAGACVAGTGAILTKAAYELGADPRSFASASCIPVGLAPLGFLLYTRSRGLRISRSHCLAAGFSLFASSAFVLFALDRMSAAVAILILFSAPAWIAITERVLWKRRHPRTTWLSIVAVLIGLTVMAWPFGGGLEIFGASLALAGVAWRHS